MTKTTKYYNFERERETEFTSGDILIDEGDESVGKGGVRVAGD